MTFDLWDHQFCLTCDKQVNIDGAAYCSETCRLSDFEKTGPSSPDSLSSSPGSTPASYPWTFSSLSPSTPSAINNTRTKFYLSPSYDFSNAQPYGSTPVQRAIFGNYTLSSTATESTKSTASTTHQLSPSSSQSSLVSLQSSSTAAGESGQLSDRAKQELRAYAISFDQVRMQRRQSN